MAKLYNACKSLIALQNLSSRNAKKRFIQEHSTDSAFLGLLKALLNPYANYKIRSLQPTSSEAEPTLTYDAFIDFLHLLSVSNINTRLRKQAIYVVSSAPYEIAHVIEGIITKSFSLGIDKDINKALGYELVPEFDVMLASPLAENSKIPIPCQVDLKYDGVRCLAIIQDGKCTLYTRKGQVLNFPKIEKELSRLASGFSGTIDTVFDGELTMASRTNISGVCNTNLRKGYVEYSDDLIIYNLFDTMSYWDFKDGTSLKQSERSLRLQKMITACTTPLHRVKLGESQTVFSEEKLNQIANDYIKQGYEGVIIKDPDAVYETKRSKAWLKIKAVNSATLEVVDIAIGKGKRKDKVGALLCKSSCGNILVKVGSGLDDETVEAFTRKPPIGKFVEVLFNVVIRGENEDYYSLFLPRYKELRIDKTEADSLEKILKEHIGKPEITNRQK